jgi:hypothetical protein
MGLLGGPTDAMCTASVNVLTSTIEVDLYVQKIASASGCGTNGSPAAMAE